MKALLVADNEKAINNISEVLKAAGYDTIVYKWLLKALDNIEEIAPHLIVVSTGDYPRHWKTLAQYASIGFGDYSPQIILYTDENFNEEEQKKAEALNVRGFFDSIDVEGLDKLREILTQKDDIFSGHLSEDSFDTLVSKLEKTNEDNIINSENEQTIDELAESMIQAEEDEKAADRLEEITLDEAAADRLEEISGDEAAADKLERLAGNEEILTVTDIINEPFDDSESTALPGEEELKKLLAENNFAEKSEEVFEESKSNDIIEKDEENAPMADEQNIEDKLAEIMNANKADQKERAEALKLDLGSSSVSFVFTNPVTLAMVSGVARNYNGLVLEFTPDIPAFIRNLSPGTKIGIASMKIDDKIENVFAEVMSNDAKKLALAIKK